MANPPIPASSVVPLSPPNTSPAVSQSGNLRNKPVSQLQQESAPNPLKDLAFTVYYVALGVIALSAFVLVFTGVGIPVVCLGTALVAHFMLCHGGPSISTPPGQIFASLFGGNDKAVNTPTPMPATPPPKPPRLPAAQRPPRLAAPAPPIRHSPPLASTPATPVSAPTTPVSAPTNPALTPTPTSIKKREKRRKLPGFEIVGDRVVEIKSPAISSIPGPVTSAPTPTPTPTPRIDSSLDPSLIINPPSLSSKHASVSAPTPIPASTPAPVVTSTLSPTTPPTSTSKPSEEQKQSWVYRWLNFRPELVTTTLSRVDVDKEEREIMKKAKEKGVIDKGISFVKKELSDVFVGEEGRSLLDGENDDEFDIEMDSRSDGETVSVDEYYSSDGYDDALPTDSPPEALPPLYDFDEK